MSIRKRRDSEGPRRGAMGVDGHGGEKFGKTYLADPWGYGSKETVYEPPYAPASDGASASAQRTSKKDFQFRAKMNRDIFSQVMAVHHNANWGFDDGSGPVAEVEGDDAK
jgi:hypothetical protein